MTVPLTSSEPRITDAGPVAGTGAPARPVVRWCLGTRLLVGGAVAWAVLLAIHLILSGRWWFWLLVETVPPIVLLAVPTVLLAAVPFAARAVRLPVLGLLAATLAVGMPLSGLTPATVLPDPAPPPGAVRVLSWNPEYWHEGDDPARFYDYLRAQDADVYLLQEYLFYPGRPQRIDDLARLRTAFPGYRIMVAGELITLSRLPVVGGKPIDASPWMSVAAGNSPPADTDWRDYWTTKALRTDVQVGRTVMSFYNVHLAVQVEITRSPFAADFYRFVRAQHGRRDAHLRALRADLADNPNPVLLSGDLNSTSAMRDLRRIGAGLRRHDPTTGSPLPATWPTSGVALPRLWRLDWTFTRGEVRVHRYRLASNLGLSDHLAQQMTISN